MGGPYGWRRIAALAAVFAGTLAGALSMAGHPRRRTAHNQPVRK
jgi:hypothetical protein